MERRYGRGATMALGGALLWRLLAEVVERRRQLLSTGELQRRLDERRARRVREALRDERLPQVVPIPRYEREPGILAAAIRAGRGSGPRSRSEGRRAARQDVAWWRLTAVAIGCGATFAAVVRPLSEQAPWLALGGIALVGAALVSPWPGGRSPGWLE